MVAAVLLMSLVLAAAPAPAQPAQPQQKPTEQQPPFTLDGVRRAAVSADQPKPDQPADTPDEPEQPKRPISRSAARQQIDVATWTPEHTVRLPHDDRGVSPSLARVGPAWHQEFLAMATPDIYSPFAYMGNAERLQAVASSMAFGLGVEAVTRLVKSIVRSYRDSKLEKLRGEIDLETALVERRYKAYLAEQEKQKEGGADAAVRKLP